MLLPRLFLAQFTAAQRSWGQKRACSGSMEIALRGPGDEEKWARKELEEGALERELDQVPNPKVAG